LLIKFFFCSRARRLITAGVRFCYSSLKQLLQKSH
jgi:hypothetical protein